MARPVLALSALATGVLLFVGTVVETFDARLAVGIMLTITAVCVGMAAENLSQTDEPTTEQEDER